MPKGVGGFQKKARGVPMMAAEGGTTSEDLKIAHAPAALATPTAAKRRAKHRRSDVDPLREKNWGPERYSLETRTHFLLEKEKVEMASEKATLRSKKARAAAVARWSGYVKDEEGTVFEKDEKAGALRPCMAVCQWPCARGGAELPAHGGGNQQIMRTRRHHAIGPRWREWTGCMHAAAPISQHISLDR